MALAPVKRPAAGKARPKPSSAPQLSVVIAALNEAAALPLLLADLAAQREVKFEVIVADGGSSDGSAAVAQSAGAQLLHAPRGRARQLNAGAAAASAGHLLFLHADTRLYDSRQVAAGLAALNAAGAGVAGHWPLRFERDVPGHEYFFRYAEGKTASNRLGTINGDQGLLLAKSFFETLGGFDTSLPYFEDQRLAARIFAEGRFITLPGTLSTSARRFEREGHGPRYALMALIVGMEAAGLHDLMADLPALYKAQAETERLDLVPVLCTIHQRLAALSAAQREQVWAGVGVLLRHNAWQLAHALDALHPGSEGRLLALFARVMEPRLQGHFGLAAATALGRNVLGLCFAAARMRRALSH